MDCPYCHGFLPSGADTCPTCQLSADRVSALLGPVPAFEQPVGDRTGHFQSKTKKQLADRIGEIEHHFPQIRIRVVMGRFGAEHPLSLHAFWLFNSGQFCGAAERLGHNRMILVVIDPEHLRAAIAPGYGLEPFFSHENLDAILELARPSWRGGLWAAGIRAVLDGLEKELTSIARNIEEAFGIVSHTEHRPGGTF
ncbi:TPM domain-containing protein [Haloferula sargassicola]|uniref:TPM domain-containing protein n=1 Tax=Haloferula sargassicola TaxID=490096 RepID=A0ABP9UPF9_9BACT